MKQSNAYCLGFKANFRLLSPQHSLHFHFQSICIGKKISEIFLDHFFKISNIAGLDGFCYKMVQKKPNASTKTIHSQPFFTYILTYIFSMQISCVSMRFSDRSELHKIFRSFLWRDKKKILTQILLISQQNNNKMKTIFLPTMALYVPNASLRT